MGAYRAAFNLPELRYGKTGHFDDHDPVTIERVNDGKLIPLDAPRLVVEAPALGDADGELVTEPKPEAVVAEVEDALPAPSPPAPPASEAPAAPRVVEEVSTLNPDLGIRFDEDI